MENTQLKQTPAGAGQKPEFKIPKTKKKRKWIKWVIILAVIIALAAFFVGRIRSASQKLVSGLYLQETATLRDMTVSVSGTATVQPTDSYKVTALVTGEILSAPFEEGDTVQKGDVLYTIDSADVENNIEKAQLSVEQAQLSYDTLIQNKQDKMDNLELIATADGVVQKLYIDPGDTVAAGTSVALILDRDNMKLTLPFHSADAVNFYSGETASVTVGGTMEALSGTVDEVTAVDEVTSGGALVRQVTIKVSNPGAITTATTGTATVGSAACVNSGTFEYAAQETLTAKTSGTLSKFYVSEGDRVKDGQVLGVYASSDLTNQIENARISLESAKLNLQNAQDALDDYQITSPISGTIVEKNFKAGDKIESLSSGNTLAVVYDMSVLKFVMNIDELDIGQVKAGQEVSITADALEGKAFTGHVDKVNINGSASGSGSAASSGVTTYPVTVVIDNPGELLPGMNVTADIIVEHAANVLSIPVDAVQRGNTVLTPGEGAFDQNGQLLDITKLQSVPVTLGRSDGEYIEVLSGLSEGDKVVIENQASSILDLMTGRQGGQQSAQGS